VLRAIDLPSVRSRGYAFQVELTYRALVRGLRVVEIPIVFRDRALGSSKMSWQITAEAAWLVPQLRRGAAHLRHPAAEAQAPASSRRIDTG
jgi:dolichol-phosphate mannosyltransferase